MTLGGYVCTLRQFEYIDMYALGSYTGNVSVILFSTHDTILNETSTSAASTLIDPIEKRRSHQMMVTYFNRLGVISDK